MSEMIVSGVLMQFCIGSLLLSRSESVSIGREIVTILGSLSKAGCKEDRAIVS